MMMMTEKRSDALKILLAIVFAFFSVLFATAEKTPRKIFWVPHVDQSADSTEIFVDFIDEEVSRITLNWNVLSSDIWYV